MLWVAGGWSWQAVERTGWMAAIVAVLLPITGVWVWALRSSAQDTTPPSGRSAINLFKGDNSGQVVQAHTASITFPFSFEQASDTSDTTSPHNRSVLFYEQGDFGKAEQWWRRAAEKGNIDAMGNLGTLFYNQGELRKAEQWWRRAEEASES